MLQSYDKQGTIQKLHFNYERVYSYFMLIYKMKMANMKQNQVFVTPCA